MRRVLIPAYYFPPYGEVNIFRIAKFVKYLPQNGWKPYVVTVTPETHRDTEQVHEFHAAIEAAEVMTIPVPFDTIIERVGGVVGTAATSHAKYVSWTAALIRRLTRIVRTRDIDLLFASGGPFVPLCSLPVVARRTGVPYVIDLRDPWTTDLQNISDDPNPIRKWIATVGEPRVLRGASRVTTVTDQLQSDYQSRYPDLADRIDVIFNGFDSDDYADAAPEAFPDDTTTIVYPGSWYGREHASSTINALAAVAEQINLHVVHYGHLNDEIMALINAKGLSPRFDARGYASRSQVASTIKGADIGLVISRGSNALSTKLFDYLGCNIPIVGVGAVESELQAFLSQFEYTHFADKHDSKAIQAALQLLARTRPTALGNNERDQFDFEVLTGELAAVLENSADG